MRTYAQAVWMLVLAAFLVGAGSGVGAQQARHDDLLIGFHFGQGKRMAPPDGPASLNYYEFADFLKEDFDYLSYIDFWYGWSGLERYKGDEKGLAEMDEVVNDVLARGQKVKCVLIHNTWWPNNLDWATTHTIVTGPERLDDWAHWCELMGTHFRGRVTMWDLQGEANGRDYWPFLKVGDLKHISDVYKIGCLALHGTDPGGLVGVSGATPGIGGLDIYGEKISKAQIDRWYRDNLTACKGLYDNVFINYFADVPDADPYGSGWVFYKYVRDLLDGLGQKHVEIGSGESSVQWANTSYDLKSHGLSVANQAKRFNETLAMTYSDGMNKWIWHGVSQPTGLGWPWRWGFRKYEDFWGVYPESVKVPGTNIVYTYTNKKDEVANLLPAWKKPADPRLPSGTILNWWAQAMPRGAEAVRLPVTVQGAVSGKSVQCLGSFLRSRNEAVVLVYREQPTSALLQIDMRKTGWPEGLKVAANVRTETINFDTGERTLTAETTFPGRAADKFSLGIPTTAGWTTIRIRLVKPDFDAQIVTLTMPKQVEAGQKVVAYATLRNSGAKAWPARWGRKAQLLVYPEDGGAFDEIECVSFGPEKKIRPGDTASWRVELPGATDPQQLTCRFRMALGDKSWFGPVAQGVTRMVDTHRPRKLVAWRQAGHVLVKWFAPEAGGAGLTYELYRAPGFDAAPALLATLKETEYVDTAVEPGKTYYYQVVAVDAAGKKSRASARDNAYANAQPWFYDAEIVSHTTPAAMRVGVPATVKFTLKNTGSKPWDCTPEGGMNFFLQTSQLWGCQEEGRLPRLALPLGEAKTVAPGQSVTLEFPYVAPRPGRFENHWIMRMGTKKSTAWFGTPLLVETTANE